MRRLSPTHPLLHLDIQACSAPLAFSKLSVWLVQLLHEAQLVYYFEPGFPGPVAPVLLPTLPKSHLK
jgi:hypothetical protein